MDVNGDGEVDILSGSYSRHDRDMAGLFQVLWGKGKGEFKKAEGLKGTDGELLIIPANRDNVTDKICTRPTAVDLDGDGDLDIVSGNFAGSFAVFKGEGEGKFAPKPEWLMTGDRKLMVSAHSDPFFFDWDNDGDLDLLSGSSQGGVYLFENVGSATQPKFGEKTEVLKATGYSTETTFGDGHLTVPQSGTRVWVDDVNGDGRFDVLIGDNSAINTPADGLDEKTAHEKLDAWNARRSELAKEMDRLRGEDRKAAQKEYTEHWKSRDQILKTERTGFVWVMYQKTPLGGR